MPPLSTTEKQKLLIQQEIARLQGQIASSSGSSHSSSYHPYRGSSRGGHRGYSRGGFRGRGRGRGRGGSYSLTVHTPASTSAPPASALPAEKEEGEVSPSPPPSPKPAAGSGWISSTSRGGNMSLMTVQKRKQLNNTKPATSGTSHVQMLQSTSESTPSGTESKRVVIDGVIFQFEEGGKQLTRIGGDLMSVADADLPELSAGSSAAAQGTPTRHRLKYGGQQYRRTKRGNLVSRAALEAKRAEQATKPCRYYTKTGRCDRALTCPYQHIPDRLSVCPAFLSKKGCSLGESCPLSHKPSAHNTPSCIHFQASANCLNPKCPYPHVRVANDAPVCEQFAREGWCDREAGTCPELHVWECPEFHAKGTCSRQPRCGLTHVVHAEKLKKAVAATKTPDPEASGSFEDQADFIGLPGEVFSESDSDEEDTGEDEEGDEDEDVADSDGQSVAEDGQSVEASEAMDTDSDYDEARVLEEV
ncbi:hypothetical protein CC85DRAFT_292032 [Cutaneotrichosporon oleaginosum]|uniref:C3H1-type domain-containing protein n=1 Tax=Cutaneotrichosporon oleaginosum TaxID=879819 RepID=A0A0J0XN69_9TREE|nr:uncharacterized protein CC85DRAFT_292032 [Cutaneotrichosporon oleaginosum]KLT42527.1 hypothetical protein CC85DRAFT_292032 [Cutaneotrichosporon oleaginosum]TXT07799.1 hypothetical protein COLE_04723 [Cutaneotrichosporon oleaginosum]